MPIRVRSFVFAVAIVVSARSLAAAQSETSSDRVHRPIAFAPCPDRAGFECGTVTLPIDYERPWLGAFEMAVARARATGNLEPLTATPSWRAGFSDRDAVRPWRR